MEGCLKLGIISSTKKNFEEGKVELKKSLELAEQAWQPRNLREGKVLILSGNC